ncbi:hypothetical protein TREES_T100021065 [Tupaia chinensis]|uniref:Uncharacterized protein n=1 Tax=Tupaia chinensis TaxID=246437 RepID=L9JEN2_TUPCH|nr:hypothetical protein TREES_T100021065 [Tupaia chinensis]
MESSSCRYPYPSHNSRMKYEYSLCYTLKTSLLVERALRILLDAMLDLVVTEERPAALQNFLQSCEQVCVILEFRVRTPIVTTHPKPSDNLAQDDEDVCISVCCLLIHPIG